MASSGLGHLSSFSTLVRGSNPKVFLYLVHKLVSMEKSNLFLLNVCYYHVIYAFQSESTLYSCLNVKELLSKQARYLKFK